ncbi:MAG: CBS domain-containing protein [Actinomycetota bacterium]|nr:CBS domain-containing protein [Actinomycetota bacterium]
MAYKVPIVPRKAISGIRASRARRLTTIAEIRSSIIPLSGLIGIRVTNQAGAEIGALEDLVVRWAAEIDYPPVTGLVVKVGGRRAFVEAEKVEVFQRNRVVLKSAKLDLRDFKKRNGEVLLAKEVLDHQLVDVEGIQVIRAAELYLAHALGRLRLVGVEVGVNALVRRLAPRRVRADARPVRVIDWSDVAAFDETSGSVKLRNSRASGGIRRLRPAELADLLEDLGRHERSGLIEALGVEAVADALEEMDAEPLESLIRSTEPEVAADLVASMEPDEAAEALRDLEEGEREELLDLLEPDLAAELKELISYEEDSAGGVMTTVILEASEQTPISAVVKQLAEMSRHASDLDGVAVVDHEGIFVGDVSIFDLLVAPDPDASIGSLVAEAEAVAVAPEDDLESVAESLITTRRSSVVVARDGRPVGRILADDLVDAFLPQRQRGKFPRLLS